MPAPAHPAHAAQHERSERLESVAAPKQARSERTLQRLLDAAEALIRRRGLAAVSVPEIVRHAGSSIGGFYGRFRDKNELLRAIEERFWARMRARVDAVAEPGRWRSAGLPEIARALIHELVRTFGEERPLIEAMLWRAAHDPSVHGDQLRFRRRVAERVGALVLARSDEIRHPEPAVAVDLGVQVAFATMLQHVLLGGTVAGGRALSDAQLEQELRRAFLGYLGVTDAADPTPLAPAHA